MTAEHKTILERIGAYAEKIAGADAAAEIPVSLQLEKLRPVMEEIASEKGLSLEDVFILYLDLTSEAAAEFQQKLKEDMADLSDGENPILFR